MTRINLYPWRLEREEQSKKNFFLLLMVSSVVMFLFNLFSIGYYSHQIEKQTNNNAYINEEIIKTNTKLREISEIKSQIDAILARVSVLQKIDNDRYSTINILNEIIDLINPLIVLNSLSRANNIVSITGHSESNSGVAKFLRAIELSSNFSSAELKQITVLDQKQSNSDFQNFFELNFVQNIKYVERSEDGQAIETETNSDVAPASNQEPGQEQQQATEQNNNV